ncbi:non-specific lipid transfer protein GPI-anchored 14 [Elaeis guineensis]|uniref:Protein YLS3 n=1 Tax=Elaeis guineensis var. tenera TaxID=51953 RepID=A0A1D5AIV3_ELAGV|nr:protein YLS3 [Elaeis guineensis]XP_010917573.1 protein YLS3 [Elaeis guineensis]AOC88979.1 type 3 nonspecific lipid transfer protein LTP301 [Elaeis guineensis]AOC88980.1 type 3 nonspecific lipid transfer protein LTP302 [Elaeis guineensis]
MATFYTSSHYWVLLLVLCLFSTASSDVSSDQKECSDQLVGLATCLSFVQGNAKAPTPDCCTGLKQVLAKSPKCLCILIKDSDDPQLGIKFNVSLALRLPSLCSAPANISECPKLLNLPPNSQDAEIFKQAANTTQDKGNSTSSGSTGVSAQASSGGRSYHLGGPGWVGAEKVVRCLPFVVPALLLLT